MRRAAVWAASIVLAVGIVSVSQGASTTYTHGYDVSWPQCRSDGSSRMPASNVRYLILGLTHGAGHTVNPCLSAQLSWARSHHVPVGAYLVPSFPTTAQLNAAATGPYGTCGTDRSCRLRNDGARQAADALATMKREGVPAPMVWVDVEFRHTQPWSKSRGDNASVVDGVLSGLRTATMPYGIYTTSYMWSHIVGGYRVNAPNWLPAGSGDPADARAKCRSTGSGGVTWIGQYTHTYDQNLTCPVMDAAPGHHGPLYRYRNTVLSMGNKGEPVRLAQQALGAPAEVNGTFDERTLAAVVTFQVEHQLPADGRIDNDEWRALGAYKLYGGHPFLLPKVVAQVP
jgi:hypothetical protein